MFKFRGAGQRDTPVATIDNIVYIISKLPGEIARKFAEQGSTTLTQLLGGSLTLAATSLAIRAEQQQLARDDPTNIMRVFGRHAEAQDDALVNRKLQKLSDERKERVKQKATNRELMDSQRDAGFVGVYYPIAQNIANQTVMGFKESTTAFKKTHKIPIKDALPDYMDGAQLAARSMFEQLAKRKAETSGDGDAYTKELYTISTKLNPVLADLGVHNSESNPFVKMNRRLKRTEQEIKSQGERIRALEAKKQPTITNYISGTVSTLNQNQGAAV